MYCNLASDKLPDVHEQIGDRHFTYNSQLNFHSFIPSFKGDKGKIQHFASTEFTKFQAVFKRLFCVLWDT